MNTFLNNLWTWIKDAVIWVLESLSTVADWLTDAIVYVVKGVLFLIFDGVLLTIQTIVSTLDLSAISLQWAAGKGLIPVQAAYLMCAIGFPQFVSIIAAAFAVRFIINMIPTVAGTGVPNL
ncbi:MAG: hypothetical protein HY754_09170 [Nitrospirae bacterium]|nr:hypothetical protein [Nitrospirota bacterium]